MRYKGKKIGNPEVWQIAEYIALKGYRLSAQAVYDKYNAKGWVNYKGEPIKSLEAIVDSQNGVMLHKERKAEKKAQRKAQRNTIHRLCRIKVFSLWQRTDTKGGNSSQRIANMTENNQTQCT